MSHSKSVTTLLLVVIVLTIAAKAQNSVTYIYDEAGRLVGVVDPSGAAAAYKYDAAGNILSITRYTAAQVAIIDFTPNGGSVGSTVTINGTGFSATPSQNAVTFNGTSAVLTSSTTTQIVATVPMGATSGNISVTSPLGTATSADSFSVGTNPAAPFITSFTPTLSGSPGGTLTINGGNFSTTPSANKVKINLGYAAVTSSTTGTLSVSVPQGATSGRFTVTTANGTALSNGDFFTPPAGQLLATGARMTIGGTSSMTVPANGWAGTMIFDATAGQRVSLNFTNTGNCAFASNSGVSVSIMDPFSNYLVGGYCYTNGSFFDPITIPVTGTYTILQQTQFSTVTTTFSLYDVVDLSGSITVNGPQVPVTISTPGQNANLTFTGTQNQQITFTDANSTIPDLQWDLYDSTGAKIFFGGFPASITLTMNGTYTFVVDPNGAETGSVSVAITSP